MNTKILEFILLVQEMRLAQKQCLRSKNQDLVVRRLQLEIDVDVALHSIAKEKEPAKSQETENGSFVTSEYIRVYCCKCEELLTLDGDNYACFNDMEEAKSSIEHNDWKLEGNQATCDVCLENEKEVQS